MQKNHTILLLAISLLSCDICISQPAPINQGKNYPQNYFQSPLAIPLLLSGNFGEIRSNHFHAGIDIKTESVEGKNVSTAANGYVSRIKVSPFGYGKTLYIAHPNGYTTVYAHLKKFNTPIEKYIKKAQYAKESFAIELFPHPHQIEVKKGEIIAMSGNTGGSGGPHLHFEIRNAITEYPVNPLLFGFDIKDTIKPMLKGLTIYPLNNTSHTSATHFRLNGSDSDGSYTLISNDTITVHGEIGFGIELYDLLNNSRNKCGIFSIELKTDGKRVYYHEMETYGFHETRYINSHIDYYEREKNGHDIQKSFIDPNNHLSIYKETLNRGIITFDDDLLHEIEYIVKDTYGNTSTLKFPVRARSALGEKNQSSNSDPEYSGRTPNFVKVFKYQHENSFKTENIEINLPPNILYEDLRFEYYTSDTVEGALTPTHHIHNEYVPVHSYYTVSIKLGDLVKTLRNKAVIVSINSKGNKYSEGGKWLDNFITTKTRSFGAYTVMIDTTAPKIIPVNNFEGENMSNRRTIRIKIGDNLSGIRTYRGTIDGKWILMEYDAKKSMLTYLFDDEKVDKGEHLFKLIVKDNRWNSSKYEVVFIR